MKSKKTTPRRPRRSRRERRLFTTCLVVLVVVGFFLSNETTSSHNNMILEKSQQISSLTPSSSVLFMIFCGGPSGKADMTAILDTWGAKVQKAVIMSNTPDWLPLDRIQQRHQQSSDDAAGGRWTIHNTSSLVGGGERSPYDSWNENVRVLADLLKHDTDIQWVVRSDCDTWWNMDLLMKQLSLFQPPIYTPTQPYMMGQFYPLIDFKWVRGISDRPIKGSHTIQEDNGRNAYLSGGAGVLVTRRAIERLADCFQTQKSLAASGSRGSSNKEDMWSSRMAYECNVTLKRQDGMYQSGRKFFKVPSSLSIHRAVGDGRKGYVHPRYYERILHVVKLPNISLWRPRWWWWGVVLLVGCAAGSVYQRRL